MPVAWYPWRGEDRRRGVDDHVAGAFHFALRWGSSVVVLRSPVRAMSAEL